MSADAAEDPKNPDTIVIALALVQLIPDTVWVFGVGWMALIHELETRLAWTGRFRRATEVHNRGTNRIIGS